MPRRIKERAEREAQVFTAELMSLENLPVLDPLSGSSEMRVEIYLQVKVFLS